MKNQFRPLLALLVILPLAIFLPLQTIATPQGEADEGIDRRRRLLEQQAEKLERVIENSVENDDPEAEQTRRNLHQQRRAIGQKLAELDLLAKSEDRNDEDRRRDRDEDDEEDRRRHDRDDDDDDDDRRRHDRDDDDDDDDRRRRDRDEDDEEDERGVHLRAAMEHLQGAGFSARTARQVIGEIIRREREDDGRHDDRHEAEHRRHAEEQERHHHDRDEHDRDHHDRDGHDRDGHDDEEAHKRDHHQMANQLEALRREVSELRQLLERMSKRR